MFIMRAPHSSVEDTLGLWSARHAPYHILPSAERVCRGAAPCVVKGRSVALSAGKIRAIFSENIEVQVSFNNCGM